MKTRAKFTCESVTKRRDRSAEGGYVYDAHFGAVSRYGSEETEENKSYWQWTPAGQITMSTIRDDFFEVGKDYYVDFTPVPEPGG